MTLHVTRHCLWPHRVARMSRSQKGGGCSSTTHLSCCGQTDDSSSSSSSSSSSQCIERLPSTSTRLNFCYLTMATSTRVVDTTIHRCITSLEQSGAEPSMTECSRKQTIRTWLSRQSSLWFVGCAHPHVGSDRSHSACTANLRPPPPALPWRKSPSSCCGS